MRTPHPDYTCRTVSNSPDQKCVEVTFNKSRSAEIARAFLLMEGYTPAELQLKTPDLSLPADKQTDNVRNQAQNRTLTVTGKNATDFNFFYKNAYALARKMQEYAFQYGDTEVGLPTVEFNAKRKTPQEKIYPAMQIDRPPVRDTIKTLNTLVAGINEKLVESINEKQGANKQLPKDEQLFRLVDGGRKIDIEQDRQKAIDFVPALRKLVGMGHEAETLRRQGPSR